MKIRTLTLAAVILATSFGMPFLVNAAAVPTVQDLGKTNPSSNSNVTLVNPLGTGTDLNSLLNSILQFVVRIGAIVVVLMLVFVGYKFVAARGNPTAISEARNMLLWTIVGALILLGAQVIAMGIQATVQSLSTGQSSQYTGTQYPGGNTNPGGGANLSAAQAQYDAALNAFNTCVQSGNSNCSAQQSALTAAKNALNNAFGNAGGARGSECKVDKDCASGLTCDQSICSESQGGTCTDDAECGAGLWCNDGMCTLDKAQGESCTLDSECGSGLSCSGGVCSFNGEQGDSCTYDADCGDGLTCDGGICSANGAEGDKCTGDSDCGDGLSCTNGACVVDETIDNTAGCMDQYADNYDSSATTDNGSCNYTTYNSTD